MEDSWLENVLDLVSYDLKVRLTQEHVKGQITDTRIKRQCKD